MDEQKKGGHDRLMTRIGRGGIHTALLLQCCRGQWMLWGECIYS